MTRDREIERVLDHWFVDGPTSMPDRVMTSVLDQVDRTPQRRLAALLTRSLPMSRTYRLGALAAAIVVVAVAAGVLLQTLQPAPGPGQSPSQTPPGPSAPATPSLDAVPSELAHRYIGPLRTVDGLPAGDVSQLVLSGQTFTFDTGTGLALQSLAGVDIELPTNNPQGRHQDLLLIATAGSLGCAEGDVGRYPFAPTEFGSILEIQAGTDDCATRLAAIVGTWQRSGCINPDARCLGIVEPGTYRSQYFDPGAATFAETRPGYGALTWATDADGWANSGDGPSMYELLRAEDYRAGGMNEGANPPDNVTVLARAHAAALHSGCRDGVPEEGVGTDGPALAAWIIAHPGLVVVQEDPFPIDGLSATVLDIAVAEDWTETCDDVNPFIAAPLFAEPDGYHWALAQGDRMRLFILDIPTGGTVVITIDPQDPSTFDQLMSEAMPIVESFDFSE